jgi:6-phosphogluconolactonase (cycloisomerase 2 family)
MSNAAEGNEILAFDRLADGRLVPAGSYPTGGMGTGGGLGNQGGVVLSGNGRWLLAVNAGSHEVSVFHVGRRGLRLTDLVPSGGSMPISVTEHRGTVYVLNAGTDNITGFSLSTLGRLTPIASSTQPLSGAGVGPAQVSFSPDGDHLVVTEKNTNLILVYPVDGDGVAAAPLIHNSAGQTPFGFAFGRPDQLIVSEAFGGAPDASAMSSYTLDGVGGLTPVSPTVPTTETAACWVVVTPDFRFAYTTNTGSGSISGYRISPQGELELLHANGRTGVTGPGSTPIDMALSRNGRFLYALAGGTHRIEVFRVGLGGRLFPLPGVGGLPAGTNGLAAR